MDARHAQSLHEVDGKTVVGSFSALYRRPVYYDPERLVDGAFRIRLPRP